MKSMNLDNQCVQTLRVLSVEQVAKANSGHPGIALGAAPMMHVLYSRIMNVNPKQPDWINRDRFVMAAGHGSALVYSMLHLGGYGLTIDDLKQFRQLNSRTPGHPESELTKGVDASSGPLGQGIAAVVGLAISETFLAAKYNREDCPIIDHYTYAICGDGDLQEGVALEAMSLAGHLQLGKLIILFDSNDIQLDTEVAIASSDHIAQKVQAMNWNYEFVENGEDIDAIALAIAKAKKQQKPTLVEVKTIIGRSSSVAGTPKAHGAPLPKEDVLKMRMELGGESFKVSSEVLAYYHNRIVDAGTNRYDDWMKRWRSYQNRYPKESAELEKAIQGEVFVDFTKDVPSYDLSYKKATRQSSGEVLEAISKIHPTLMGGAADLSSSTKTVLSSGRYSKDSRVERNIYFGVREHAMAAISNGMALHKGVRPFCSTFFVFSDYTKPAVRLSAIMELPVIYIFTHDSIAVGEDGPTHQPIEQITMLRSIPNLQLLRPADATEVVESWEIAMKTQHKPTVIVLTRQDVPTLRLRDKNNLVEKGAYILDKEKGTLNGILLASGSEVELARDTKRNLEEMGIFVRVVSIPSTQLFDMQDTKYKEQVLPAGCKNILAIEASDATHMYKYVGKEGVVFGINRYGKSAKASEVLKDYGFTVENITEVYKSMKAKNQ